MIEEHLDPERAASKLTLLDFGCGCGRLLRYLSNLSNRHRIIGIDVNAELLAWCAQHLPGVETQLCSSRPPIPLQDGDQVDASIALSVFTHLDASATREWITEFVRVTRRGGLVAITTHGNTALDRVNQDPSLLDILGITEDVLPTIRSELSSAGAFFHRYSNDRMDEAKAGDNYGVSFSSRESIIKAWAPHFELVHFVEGGLRGWQDVSLLRRKS